MSLGLLPPPRLPVDSTLDGQVVRRILPPVRALRVPAPDLAPGRGGHGRITAAAARTAPGARSRGAAARPPRAAAGSRSPHPASACCRRTAPVAPPAAPSAPATARPTPPCASGGGFPTNRRTGRGRRGRAGSPAGPRGSGGPGRGRGGRAGPPCGLTLPVRPSGYGRPARKRDPPLTATRESPPSPAVIISTPGSGRAETRERMDSRFARFLVASF